MPTTPALAVARRSRQVAAHGRTARAQPADSPVRRLLETTPGLGMAALGQPERSGGRQRGPGRARVRPQGGCLFLIQMEPLETRPWQSNLRCYGVPMTRAKARRENNGARAPRQLTAVREPSPPASVARWLAEPHRKARRDLADAVQAQREAEAWLVACVRQARAAGLSWAAVGEVLGVTGEGARKRWARVVE